MPYRKLPDHTSENYLRAILESIAHYNSHSRADIANWLYEGYKQAGDIPEKQISKKAIILELLAKWVEEWEHVSVLGLMFGDTGIVKDKEPFEIYSNYHTQEIARFLHKAKKGLSLDILHKIYGIKPAKQMLKEGVIHQREYPFFRKYISETLKKKGRSTFFNMAREFVSRRRPGKQTIDYSFLINVYFNTKHGFKMIHPTDTSKKLWIIQEEDIVLVDKIQKKGNRKLLIAGIFKKFSGDEVKLLVERINGWADVTREIALAQLEYLENSNWLVPDIRAEKTRILVSEKWQKTWPQ